MKIIQTKYITLFLVSLVLLNPAFVNAEQTGDITVTVKNQSGDLAQTNTMELKVYQDFLPVPIIDIVNVPGNPYTISNLPLNHHYKVEIYEDGMHVSYGFVELKSSQENLDLTIPNGMGMRIKVLYNDGYTPIPNAQVHIKSNDDVERGNDTTSRDGVIPTQWLSTSINDTDFYYVDVTLGPDLHYIYSPIAPTSQTEREFDIVTDWPKIVSNLINIQVYKSPTQLVSPSDGNYIVELRDNNNNKILDSQVDQRGQGQISNVPVSDYYLFVLKKDPQTGTTKEIISKKVAIQGIENTIKIFINNPELNSNELNCKCVAFRLDDVQDYYVNSVQMAIINLFIQKNASLTIGIIGEPFGKDQKLVNFLKTAVAKDNPIIEPAIHSWDHRDMTKLNKQEQFDQINQTSVKLQSIFGFKPDTFIPPFNHFNEDTLNLLQQYGITHISYHTHTQEPPPFTKETLYQFPATTSTASIELLGVPPWKVVSADSLMQDVQNELPHYGYAIVNMHPYEFAEYTGLYTNYPNSTQLYQLGLLIDKVKAAGYQILPIDRIDKFNQPITPPPQPIQTSTGPNCNCVAFRLDAVQDHYLTNVQDALMSAFQKTDTSLTVGIFGKNIGVNPKIVAELKAGLKGNNPLIEIANHGWENLDHTQYPEELQSKSIQMTNKQLATIFGVTPTVFIPPYNKFNNDTIAAMRENGIRYLSSATTLDSAPYNLHNDVPFHVPQTDQIFYLLEDDPFFTGTINQQAVSKIGLDLNKTGFSIVTLRTQDFATKNGATFNNQVDGQKLQNLESLLEYIKSNGIKTVTLDKIPSMATSQQSPGWTNHLYTLYQDGQISHYDVITAMNYLIKNNIVKFNS